MACVGLKRVSMYRRPQMVAGNWWDDLQTHQDWDRSTPIGISRVQISCQASNTFGVGIQQYADDTQLYVSLSPTDMHAQQSLLSDCLSALHSWFCHNGLALNSTKSESILIGTCQRLCTLPPVASPIITGTSIPFSYTIKMLGVTLDQNLTLNKHVSLLSHSIHF